MSLLQMKQFLTRQFVASRLSIIFFLIPVLNDFRVLNFTSAAISPVALFPSRLEIDPFFHLFDISNLLFLNLRLCFSTIRGIVPLGSSFLLHFQIILHSASFSSSSRFSML